MSRIRNDLDGITEWVISGDRGAVSFLVLRGEKTHDFAVPCVIGIHSPVRRKDHVRGRCDLLPAGTCYCRQLDGLDLWSASHGKDEIIYAALENWHRAFLGDLR